MACSRNIIIENSGDSREYPVSFVDELTDLLNSDLWTRDLNGEQSIGTNFFEIMIYDSLNSYADFMLIRIIELLNKHNIDFKIKVINK